jgi:hypothetical protein
MSRADSAALAEMLYVHRSPSVRKDGVDTVREALDDTQFLRDLAKHLHREVDAEYEDDGVLARMVRNRVRAYARSCPTFEDQLDELELHVAAARGIAKQGA